jgi:sigma-B regulation protein RsbU (phosphoserine phosphatase)
MPASLKHLKEHGLRVLLVDDQRIVGEIVRRMLMEIAGLEFRFCADPALALAEAEAFAPTVILQDLVMPGVDGIEMVRTFRQHPATSAVPLVVLSSKEEPTTKAEAFAAGANDYLVKLPDKLELVARIRYHSDAYIHRLERDEAFAALEAQQLLIEQELAEAARYVQSLLPPPMPPGSPVVADWRFITSSSLGGDSFGYHWLSQQKLAVYLLDVCGHGVGAALLSVSAINTVRNRTLPGVDFEVPSQVLAGLNRAFPMEGANGRYFTMFYGVYDTATRQLLYASGGHPPVIVVHADATASPLAASGLIIGLLPETVYKDSAATLAQGAKLFVFSDGCYEVFDPSQKMLDFDGFSQILTKEVGHPDTLDRVVASVRQWQGRTEFEDDFSLVEFAV